MLEKLCVTRWLRKSILFSALLLKIVCIQTVTAEHIELDKLFVDMTKQLNEVISGDISTNNFSRILDSNPVFGMNNLGTTSMTVFYNSDCNILEAEQCSRQIQNVAELFNKTIPGLLTIFLTVDIPTIIELGKIRSTTKIELPDLPINLVLNFHEETKCEDWRRSDYVILKILNEWIPLSPTTKVGFGYSEALLPCVGNIWIHLVEISNFFVLTMKFGNTVGVTESFGLFQKRMDSLHQENVKFIKGTFYRGVNKTPTPIYYPTSSSVGDETHRRLLVKYAQGWVTSSEVADKSIVVQAPYFEPEIMNEFSVIPTVPSNTCSSFDFQIEKLIWYAPSALAAISKFFKSVILNHEQWTTLNSEKLKNLYSSIKIPSGTEIHLDIIIDYSDTLVYHDPGLPTVGTCSYNWVKVEDELNTILMEPLKSVTPKVLIFQLSNIGTIRMRAHAPIEFVKKVSPKLKFGCSYWKSNGFGKMVLNESEVASIVEACKEINGSLYLIKSEVTLEPKNYQTNYHLHYEDSVRKELDAVNSFRKEILRRHPEAQVYLGLDVTATRPLEIKENYKVTAFCNQAVLEGNLYIEAIVNWAKFNNFPIILKSAFDYLEGPEFLSWLSFLRPQEYLQKQSVPSVDEEDEEEMEEEENHGNIAALFPSFVMRNYPSGINNWTIEPCIEWTQHRLSAQASFFHNHHIGTILDTTDFINQELPIEAYEILLQFILHRFQVAEIVVEKNHQDVMAALKSLSEKNLVGPNHTLFISYFEADHSKNLAPKSTSELKKFLEDLSKEKSSYLSGVYVDLHKSLVIGEEEPLLELLLNRTAGFNFDVGILINSSSCLTAAEIVLLKHASSEFLKMFSKLNYIVCKSEFELLSQDDQLNLGTVFDTHLYLKRIFQQIQPNLKVFFRVEISVTLNKDKETMNRYLRLLSHFHKFGSAYDINYFIVEAFDGDSKNGQANGWWAVKNYTDLTNPHSFVEKESVYSGRSMWYPPVLIKTKVVVANSKTTVIATSVSFLLLIVLAIFSTVMVMRYKKLSRYLTDQEVQEFLNGKENPTKETTDQESKSASAAEYMKFKADYDIPKADFSIDNENVLGAGNFGTVYKGSAKGKEAAIKKPNQDCPKGTFKTILTEIKVMCYIGMHPNIVGFFGAYTKEINKGILFVATEYCSNGSLESYLRKKKQVVARQEDSVYQNTQLVDFLYSHELHQFSTDIANGMAYIESKQVVHGDLAARNVLLDENFNCKIGDFGLSRKLYEYQKYVKKSQEPLPWKWMAYESLTKMEFTSKSDVWSYGVTLWEIYSLGNTPYGGLNWTMEFADELRNGLRLTKPQFANEEIYSKMLDCWNLDAENRPSFSEIAEVLKPFCRSSYTVLSE
ncbi:unnamed protein product [Orchesella dallaii]|uniref:Protein kinase domain-containing protein n=1 Tax=Orchesella dallaii TaxID=48710 RepID=A0ABP1RPR7_9HEXA